MAGNWRSILSLYIENITKNMRYQMWILNFRKRRYMLIAHLYSIDNIII